MSRAVDWCERCRKYAYTGRKAARRKIRTLPQHGKQSAYKCPGNETWWHIGHLRGKS